MTPFAQLGYISKSANTPRGYEYQTNPNTGLRDPYSSYQTVPGTQQHADAQSGWGWGDTGQLALDIGMGTNPFTGVPYYGGKALYDLGKGNYWSALGNLGWGALSFIPGIGVGAGKGLLAAGGRVASKMTPKAVKALQTGKMFQGAAPGTMNAAGKRILGAGMGAGMTGAIGAGLTGEGQPPPQPVNDREAYGVIDNAAKGIIQGNYR